MVSMWSIRTNSLTSLKNFGASHGTKKEVLSDFEQKLKCQGKLATGRQVGQLAEKVDMCFWAASAMSFNSHGNKSKSKHASRVVCPSWIVAGRFLLCEVDKFQNCRIRSLMYTKSCMTWFPGNLVKQITSDIRLIFVDRLFVRIKRTVTFHQLSLTLMSYDCLMHDWDRNILFCKDNGCKAIFMIIFACFAPYLLLPETKIH